MAESVGLGQIALVGFDGFAIVVQECAGNGMRGQTTADKRGVDSTAGRGTAKTGGVADEQGMSTFIVAIDTAQATAGGNHACLALDDAHLTEVSDMFEDLGGLVECLARAEGVWMTGDAEGGDLAVRSQPGAVEIGR